MSKKKKGNHFNGKQGQMYAVLILAWLNYKQHQKDFAKVNAKYTAELADVQIAAIKKARDMPDVAVRRDVPKDARLILANTKNMCTNNWQILSGLIEDSFPKEQWDVKKGLAGYASYATAVAEQWDAVIMLNNAANPFIGENKDALTAGGMLPEFAGQYEEASGKFTLLYDTFYGTKQDFNTQTTAKLTASNTAYQMAMTMMRDAKRIYITDEDTREEFVYSTLMKKVRGKGFIKTGYALILKAEATHLPVTIGTAVFTLANFSQQVNANEKGIIRCEAPAGEYHFSLTAPGYLPVYGTLKMVEGSMRQKTLKLTATAIEQTPEARGAELPAPAMGAKVAGEE